MTSPFVEPLPKRKRKKGPDDEIIKNVVVLKSSQVREKDGVVLMPKTTLDMSGIKKLGQSKKITFTKNTTSGDLQRKLEEKFPFLEEASGRFYCAKAVENRSKLDFCGDRCVWSGAFINKNITGNSALYIYCEEEKEGDSGHYSSDSDLSGAHVYGNCLITEAPQERKRFRSEPCSVAEGPHVIAKETLRAVESQKCGTLIESERNYKPFGQLEGVKTQLTGKEASACTVTVRREQHQCSRFIASAAEKEQMQDSGQLPTDEVQAGAHVTLQPVCSNTSDITKMAPKKLPLGLQPTLPTGDLPEQINSSTLVSQLKNLRIISEDKEIQESYDQGAKGSQSGQQLRQPKYSKTQVPANEASVSSLTEDNQQNTPVTVGASNNQESSSEDCSDSGFETLRDIPKDTSRNGDPLLSSTIRTSSPKPDEYRSNIVVETIFPINKELKEISSDYAIVPSLVDHNSESEETMQETLSRHFDCNSESEETMQDTLSRNSISMPVFATQNDGDVEDTNQDFAQEISHPRVEGDEPNHTVEQEKSHPQMDVEEPNQNVEQKQLVRKICPSSGPLEGGGDFQICVKEELSEHIQSGYAYFGNKRVDLGKFDKKILDGKIPAAQEACVVSVHVFSDADEFLGQTYFEYEDVLKKAVFQAVQYGSDAVSELFARMGKYTCDLSSNQSSFAKKNSGQATGALNDSCQDRSSPVENTVMDDEYEDVAQHFQDIVKWLSEQSFHLVHSNTDMWLKLSNAVYGLCSKLACSEDEEDFKGNQQTCLQEREENYFADAEDSSCMSSEDDSASLSDRACNEAEEDLEGDQLSCTQERDENYFPGTEDYSSVSSETSALSNSESWDESLSDSSLSFAWVNSRSSKSLQTIPETESTQHSYKAANSKPDVSHEILVPMVEGFISGESIGNNNYVGSAVCHKWNTSSPESKNTEENFEKDDHNEKPDSSEEWASYSDKRTSHTLLASHEDTLLCCLDVPTLNVENEKSQYQSDELFETPLTIAKPQSSESICSVTSNQQSATHPGPITQEAAQSPLSNSVWNGESKLNMSPPQCIDEEIHSAIIEGEGPASWFDLCENEDVGKNEHSRWEMSSIESNKTDGGVEKDVFDSEEELSQEEGHFSEQGNSHIHRLLPDDTSVQSRRAEVENKESQETLLFTAASNGQTDIVRLLIKNGADVNKGWDTPLFEAARNGHTDIVKLLIENGADVNKGWVLEGTPLCKAARNGHTDIVKLLIENGADVNKGWDTPLFEAANNGHSDIVRFLIERRADVNKADTPLFEAVRNGHTDIVRLLIESGADINKGSGDTLLFEAARNGDILIVRFLIENGADVNKAGRDTPLIEAVRNGHTDIVRLLIESRADVNKGSGDTLLFEAARNGYILIVRFLIENGADVNKGRVNTPLIEAVRNGHTDIVRLLTDSGADVNKGSGNTPLFEAARNSHTDTVKLLIESGADVSKGSWDTPLFEAAKNGLTDIVRLLTENGADVNKGWKDTPLFEAARNSHSGIVRLLIKNGAYVNRAGRDTPLSEAAKNGHTDIVRFLIENGADVNKGWDTPLFDAARNGHAGIVRLLIKNGAYVIRAGRNTPLFEAAKNGHTDIVKLLIENGADVNKGWNTPLIEAVGNGHTDIVRLLIESGADVNKGSGSTPLSEAVRNGHTDIVRFLIENGADVHKAGRILEDNPLTEAVRNGYTDIARLLIENGADVNKGIWATPLTAAVKNGRTDIVKLLIENGAGINIGGGILGYTPLTEAVRIGHTDIVRFLIENGADVNKGSTATLLTEAVKNGHTDIVRLHIKNGADINIEGLLGLNPLQKAVEIGHSDIVKLLVDNGADFNVATLSAIEIELLVKSLRRKFEADAKDTKLSLERELDVQLRGKKTASLPKRPGKRLKTQTEMTSPRDIVEEGKCGKVSMTDVELGLNCLHLSPRCEQFKPYIMEESPGDFSIMNHDFKPINKRMDRVTLTNLGKAKQGHYVFVEIAKTHPSGDMIIIYEGEINEEGSGVGEAFQLETKDLKNTWENEEMIAENVQIGSVVKYVQVGDEFLFQGNTKRPRWDMDRIFLSCTDGAHRGIGNAFPNSKLLTEDSNQDCTPKETSCFISLKCGVVENDRISVITELGELLNLKPNCREDVILPLSPSTLELSHVEDNKDVMEMEEPLLISAVDGLRKPSYPVLSEGLNLRDEPKETLVEAEKPEADLKEKDDEDGNAF